MNPLASYILAVPEVGLPLRSAQIVDHTIPESHNKPLDNSANLPEMAVFGGLTLFKIEHFVLILSFGHS